MMDGQEEQRNLSVSEAIACFLEERKQYLSPFTLRDYEIDLNRLARTYNGPLRAVTLSALEPFFASLVSLRPSSQARKYTALSRFFTWAQERQLLEQNPMANLPPVRSQILPHPLLASSTMERILQAIPPTQQRDRLMFRLIGEQGLRTTEVLALQVEDLNLSKEPLEILIQTKGTRKKTPIIVLPALDAEFRSYLEYTGYRTGPLFRAQKERREIPLSAKSVYQAWNAYSTNADISLSLHTLRTSAVLNASPDYQALKRMGPAFMSHGGKLPSYLREYRQEQKQRHFFDRKKQKRPISSSEGEKLYYWHFAPTYLDFKAITTGTAATGSTWRYTEVAEGYCTYPFYAECPHRLVCAHCSYFISKGEKSQGHSLDRDKHLLRLLQELKISAAEYEVTQNIQGAVQQLREELADVPTPTGLTPRQLQYMVDNLKNSPALPEHEG